MGFRFYGSGKSGETSGANWREFEARRQPKLPLSQRHENLLEYSRCLAAQRGTRPPNALAQTAGSAKLEATILDYTGSSSASHYAVVWVTTQAGAFVKSLRKQGPSSWTSSEWSSHCSTWNTARAGSTVLDGYSSATATTYTGTNSPIILTWNCRDAGNNLMPDGNYKFWIQYAENSGQGPYTTSGLLWTKGATTATNTYANQGANFANMKVTWSPSATPPAITSVALPATGIVGVPYNFNCTASGNAPITFTAPGLPTGLTISSAGVISGNLKAAGTFTGTITAAQRHADECDAEFLHRRGGGTGQHRRHPNGRGQPGVEW
jgi:hypothetical protein